MISSERSHKPGMLGDKKWVPWDVWCKQEVSKKFRGAFDEMAVELRVLGWVGY